MSSKQIAFAVPRLDKITSAGQAQDLAIDWQNWASEKSLGYGELVYYQNRFEEIGRKFNLTDEFKENGII